MSNVSTMKKSVITGEVAGFYDARFERVAEEFVRNFQERDEIGASVCVTLEGEPVVDLWGGTAQPETGTPWTKDSLCVVWSATKGATALCAHMLADRGLLDLDAPVVRYWPEFGQAGKETIPVKMLLNHQSGLAAISEPLPPGAFLDWELMVKALEKQKPFWTPGSMHGYQGFTFGWLVGEVVRRVSGKSLGTFFREEVAEPLGLDFWIGLPEDLEDRVGLMIPAPPPGPEGPVPPMFAAMVDPTSLQTLLMFNSGGHMLPGPDGIFGFNLRAAHAAEIGAAGGIANARALAGMYAPLANGGSLNGVRLVSQDALARMAAVSSASGLDAGVLAPTRFSLGYVKSVDNRHEPSCTENDSVILSEEAFGHSGFGGAMGFADPPTRMSFGYTMNRMGQGLGLNARGQSLIDATYLSLGYTSNASGTWIKA
ncbi:MAG TPA: serine hydrolase domain-containing protein [Ktedonobacteraceae bacterium]|nr:serine hydrolase domain-containing protein [Ktedonobacteraceae bacterium]